MLSSIVIQNRTLIMLCVLQTMAIAQDSGLELRTPLLRFGMSTALTGPAAQLGKNVKAGVDAAFAEANRSSGIHGHQLALIALDDGYEPSRTSPIMRTLIDEQDVLAVIGNVGTPTAVAAVPIANAKKTLLFGAYSGAGVLRRRPPDRYVINFRASYAEETSAMVDALINDVGLTVDEIAFFTQRDAYGDAGFFGGITALKRHGLTDESVIAHGRYERNTNAVENGLADILGARTSAKAVIMVGAYEPCASFIKLSRQFELDMLFLNVSFVGAAPLVNALGSQGEGVVIVQVVPHFMSDLPLVTQYRKALQESFPEVSPTFGSLEGYIIARILIHALQESESTPTRETIVEALELLGTFDIGLGETLQLDKDNHQACHKVWPTIIRSGEVVPLDWSQLSRR